MTARRAVDDIKRALIFAALILLASLGIRVLRSMELVAAANVSLRLMMAVTGAFLMMTGNSIPKTLTPLASTVCDPVRLQRFQRLAGWSWVLAGAALAITWLVLPISTAKPLTWLIIAAGVLGVVIPLVRLNLVNPIRRVASGQLKDVACSRD